MAEVLMKFDTLTWVKKLEKAGIPPQQAEAQVNLVFQTIDGNACTKRDLLESEGRVEVKLKDTESKLELKIEEVRREVTEVKHEVIKWFVGTFIVTISVTMSVIKIFS
ncbi:MAG: hypothetical protein V4471_02740 [Pseudomonadota bacterium]